MKIKNILVILVAFLIGSTDAISQRYCEVVSISVNSKLIDKEASEDIVIKSSDTITFRYELKGSANIANESFYYRVVLKNQIDSSFIVTGSATAPYVSLNEGNYEFTVNAFGLRESWLAKAETIKFRVNNRVAALLETIEAQSKKIEDLKAVLKPEKPTGLAAFDLISILIGLLVGLVVGAAISMIIIKLITPKTNNKYNKGAKMSNQDSIVISKEEYNKLLTENSNLRAEIAALRGQIDAMQSRAIEMKKQNKDLEESLAKISSSKDELEKLQSQKDELFALIIHDIKNPAALIKSLVDLLRSYDLSAVEQQEIINDIAETTSRIVSLSHEVSKILALETSKLILDIQPAQVSEIVSEVVRRNQVAANAKSLTMTSDIVANLPDAEVDVQKIEEVVDNLVSNAIKFTQQGGKIHVRAFVENKTINVEVSDNGLGLSETDVRNAFQRGSRLSAQPTSGESSTGLGLWIVKKLIDAHNGRVWVKSTLGKGSTFAFAIPLKHAEKAD